jgi:hypothetical protein
LQARHGDVPLADLHDLGDVVDALEIRGGRTVVQRAKLVEVLLEEASDPEVHRALLQTLLPGIVSVCRQLRFGDGIIDDPRECLAMAVTQCFELLHDWAGEHRQYAAPDILSAVRGRLRRWLLKEKDARKLVDRFGADEVASTESTLLTRLQSFAGTPQERLARLTYARVYEGRSLKDVAAADRSGPVALQVELQRFAERYLL